MDDSDSLVRKKNAYEGAYRGFFEIQLGHFPWSDMADLQSKPLLAPILTAGQIYLRLVKNCSLECVHKPP